MPDFDIILAGENVFTGTTTAPGTFTIGIKDGRVKKVSRGDKIASWGNSSIKAFRFRENLILPGFHDNHIHLYFSLLLRTGVELTKAKSEQEAAEMVYEFAKRHPEYPWIIGFGWHQAKWQNIMPSRTSLDNFLSNRPVCLLNATGHSAWVNTKALELAGISINTPDPAAGKIERDETGAPTGCLIETAADMVAKIALHLNKSIAKRFLAEFLDQAAFYGITSVDDIFPLPGQEFGDPYLYKSFEDENNLTVRIHFHTKLSKSLQQAKQYRQEFTSPNLRFSGLKQFVDGVATLYTAVLCEPYATRPDYYGKPLIPEDDLNKRVIRADKLGFKVRLHAVGDGAVQCALNAFAHAKQINGHRNSRHCIEHIEIIRPDDIRIFHELGVIPSLQPNHMAITTRYEDHPFPKLLGLNREPYFWINNSFFKTGTTPSYGTDFPISEFNPFITIHRAVTRSFDNGLPPYGWNPKEKVSVAQAIRAYTWGAAYSQFRDSELGTIEEGKLADITVLDRSLFFDPVEQIRESKVVLTIMNGKVIYND